MSLTKLQPNSVNTTATFTFANINVTNTANLGDVANVVITGGSSGQYLQTDGAGNLAWAAGGGGGAGSPGGIDTYVQFNDGGNFGGVGAFTFNKSTNSLVVGGNVTSNNSNLGNLATANYFSGNGSLLTGITASTAGTVTTYAQPNITSVGSLSGLTVSNATGVVNFTTTANVTLGAISNLHITGGTSGYVLSTDGSGTLSWVAQSGGGGSYGNSNVADYLPVYTGNVSANYFIGNGSTLTYVTGGNVYGNVTSAIQSHYANIANSVVGSNISGQVGNALVAGTVYTNAQPNITSVGTLAILSVTGNVTSGNADLGNLASATYFSGNGIFISNIAGANVSGIVANATYATSAGTAGSATTAGTVTTNAQPNITSVGTLAGLTGTGLFNLTGTSNVALGAVGNVHITGGTSGYVLSTDGSGTLSWVAQSGGGGSSYGNSNVADYLPTYTGNVSANYFIGNGATLAYITGSNVSGNVTSAIQSHYANIANSVAGSNVSGQIGNALVAGTVYTNAQPNITSVGTLGSLTVSGIGNIGYGQVGEVLKLGNSASAADKWLSVKNLSGEFQVGTQGNIGAYLYNSATSPLDFYTSASKRLTIANTGETQILSTTTSTSNSTGALVVSGGVGVTGNIYSGGLISATGNITGGNLSGTSIVGTLTTAAQTNITSVGTLAGLTGTGLFNLTGTSNVALGAVGNVHITGGTSGYVLSTDGSGALSWVAQSGGGSSYGNSNVADYLPTYTGNVSANYFIGNGATLTYIIGSNVNGNVTSAIQSHYANIANSVAGGNVSGQVGNALVAGTVYTNAQPNITSVGTLVSLSVSGDATVTGNFTVGGNTTYINVETFRVEDPIIELGGGVNGAALISNDGKDRGSILHYYTTGVVDAFMGWDNSNGEFAFGSNVSVSSEVVTFNSFGNIRANNFLGTATTAGTVTTNAQPNITSVGTLASLTVTANISSGNADLGNLATASYFSGNGIFISNIAGANVSGTVANATYATSAGSATTAATVTTNAQPNITSVGSLTGLTVSNATGIVNFTTTANVTLGAVANLHISGGTSGYVLSTDGSGTLSWVAQSGGGGGTPGGSNTQVQFNDNGSFGGNSAFTFDKTTGNVVMTGNLITGSGTGGNISGLNYVTANYFTGTLTTAAQPNVTSLGTLVSLTVTGNITSGNASLGNLASATYLGGTLTTGAQPNITSVGSLGSLTVTGLITNTGTGIKTSNIQDSSGTITIVTGYGSVSGAVGIYGNITAGTSGTGFFVGNGSYLSGLTGGNVSGQVGNALVAGTVYTNAQPNITSVGTLASLTVTGNITSGNAIIGSGSGGSISGANLVSANYFTGTLTTGAQPNITSVGTLINTTLGASNSITGGNLVSATYLTGTLTTGAQPNITSVGSLSGLTVSNATGVVNFTTTANVTLGAVANLHISGGTSGYVLQTDGSGTLSWVAQSGGGGGGSPGGLDTYVQFNDGGTTFGGNAQLTYNKVTNLLSVGGNLTISGLTTLGETTDTLNTKTGATGSVTHDLSTGVVFYHTSISANFTAALTNAPTTDGRTIVVVLFLVQGATAYIPNAVTINGGAAVTIKWLFGSTPGGNANKTDCVSFTLIRTGSAWIVLGQLATYG